MPDMNGQGDVEGFVTVDLLVPPEALDDEVDLLFRDVTHWPGLDEQGSADDRFNTPGQHRGWAETSPPTRQCLMAQTSASPGSTGPISAAACRGRGRPRAA